MSTQDEIRAELNKGIDTMFNVKEVTENEIRQARCRDYNPREWDREIDSWLNKGNVKFYQRFKKEDEYEEFYVVYTTEKGLKMFSAVSYSKSLHNGGFAKLFFIEIASNIFKIERDTRWNVQGEIQIGRADTKPETVKQLTLMSIRNGQIFTRTL